jgi:hypothetical protein
MHTPATNPQGLTASDSSPLRGPTKCCAQCGEVKALEEFERRKERSAGYRGECKRCRRAAKGRKTGEQVRQISERRRARKADARTPREQVAEMTAQDLIWALDNIPDGEEFDEWRHLVNKAVSKIRKSGRRTDSAAAQAVEAALKRPFNRDGATAADVASDTDIPVPVVERILDGLISNDRVYRFPKDVPEEARFEETIWLYKLTGSKQRSPLVLP